MFCIGFVDHVLTPSSFSHLVLSVHLSCFLLICFQYLIQGSVDSFRFGWDLAQVSVSRFWFWLAKLNVQGLGVRCVQCFSMQFIQFCYSLPQFLCLSIFGPSRFVCSVLYLEIVFFCLFNKSPWAVVLDQMIHIPLPLTPSSHLILSCCCREYTQSCKQLGLPE
jgi:hypothetical protein